MTSLAASPAEEVLLGYFRAKDGNRPHLLSRVFATDARLEIVNPTAAIAFPGVTVGREAIADVLVRNFCRTYENVYSFYLGRPQPDVTQFACPWLVGMTEKEGKGVRVGCGSYDWSLAYSPSPCATKLVITIAAMQVLASSAQDTVLAWLEGLAYPWPTRSTVIDTMPHLDELAPVRQHLSRG